MGKYLINVTETYRVDSEAEVEAILEETKASKDYELSKYGCTYKQVKKQGEIVDDWYRLVLTKTFTSEKEPEVSMEVSYSNVGGGIHSAF